MAQKCGDQHIHHAVAGEDAQRHEYKFKVEGGEVATAFGAGPNQAEQHVIRQPETGVAYQAGLKKADWSLSARHENSLVNIKTVLLGINGR